MIIMIMLTRREPLTEQFCYFAQWMLHVSPSTVGQNELKHISISDVGKNPISFIPKKKYIIFSL